MKNGTILLLSVLLGSSAFAQTYSVPVLEGPLAIETPAVEAEAAPLSESLETSYSPSSFEPSPGLAAAPVSQLQARPQARVASRTPAPRPSFLRRARSSAMASILAVGLAFGIPACGPAPDPTPPPDPNSPVSSWYVTYPNGHPIAVSAPDDFTLGQESALLDQINQDRTGSGLGALTLSQELSDVARAHSVHMPLHDFQSSVNPEGDGPGDRAAKAGTPVAQIDESITIGFDFPDAPSVMTAWQADPTLRARMEDPRWNYVGIGYHDRPSDGMPAWTVDFAQQ